MGPNIRPGEDPAALPNGDGKNQAEPHVTRSVSDPDLVLATFQEGRFSDGGAVSNGFAVSRDGGFTWHRALNPNLTTVSGGPYYRATDPVAGISLDGVLYLNSLVSVDFSFGLGRLVIQRSQDFGQTWTNPRTIYTGINIGAINRIFPDKNWMVVNDIEGSPTEGRVVVTWTNFRTQQTVSKNIQDYLITSSYSDDLGETWSIPIYVTPPGGVDFSNLQYQGSQPVFLPGGDLAIVYHNFFGSKLEVRYSPTGGASFPYGPDLVHGGYILYDAPNMREGSFLPSVDVAVDTGDLFIAYAAKQNSNDAFGHIYFVRSNRTTPDIPSGSSPEWDFSDPIIISGLLPNRVACTPTLAVSPDGQRVSVFFYDNRNGTGENNSGDFYAVQSIDGGVTWSVPFRLSEQTFPLNRSTLTSRGYMLGDYYGFAPPHGADQAGIAVWIGTPLATADPWSARIGGTEYSVLDSWLQANLPYGLRNGDVSDFLADPDRDGTPNFLEYVIGQSPRLTEEVGPFENGFSHLRINTMTDPTTQVEVFAGSGKWPDQQQLISVAPVVAPHGEGYWDSLTWTTATPVEQLKFQINGVEDWFLLEKGSPSRWVLQAEGNWVWSPWLGYIETTHAPWLFHENLGWVHDLRGALYSWALDTYLMPSASYHPWIYTSTGSYIYMLKNFRWVYDIDLETWIQTY